MKAMIIKSVTDLEHDLEPLIFKFWAEGISICTGVDRKIVNLFYERQRFYIKTN